MGPPSPLEREAKLEAWAGFRLPELGDVGEGLVAVQLPLRHLDATYYDTADLRLARTGITARFRAGDDEPEEGIWTVKLPEGHQGSALVRREVNFSGPHRVIPDAVAGLVRAYTRSSPLAPVARLVTRRRPIQLRDATGRALLEVDDDEVSVMDGRRVAVRFREIEVEAGAFVEDGLLEAVVHRLREAGAGDGDPQPKLMRALGPRASRPPEVVVPELDADASTAEVVGAAVAAGVTRLLAHDPGVRLSDDPEDLNQAYVATRRLRGDLRTFRSVLDADVVVDLRGELGWLGGELGRVGDAEALLERLERQADMAADLEPAAVQALFARLGAQRDQARDQLLVSIDGDRYLGLLDALVAAAAAPPCLADAGRRAGKLLPGLVRRPWANLESAVERLGAVPALEDLVGVRIRAERCRYAAEAAAPVMGKPARRLARSLAGLQGVLGDLNDAVVAQAWLRQAVEAAPAGEAAAAGALMDRQEIDIEKGRQSWSRMWKQASAQSLRSWLR